MLLKKQLFLDIEFVEKLTSYKCIHVLGIYDPEGWCDMDV